MTEPGNQSDYPRGLSPATGRNALLRQLLARDQLLLVPGAFDCISARLVEASGFEAVYLTGSGMSLSRIGAPDVGFLSFAEVLDQVKRVADLVRVPIIADADTGYGGPLNVIRTVIEYERAGISAIQIEDQDFPKKCGHEPGRRIVSVEEMVSRVKAAVDARRDEVVILARTDARTTEGLDAAIERAVAYVEAGADAIFFESPETEDEMIRLTKAIPAPVLANMVEGGRTPVLDAARLEEIGYKIAIFPNSLTRMFTRMGQALLADLKADGNTTAWRDRMYDHRQVWDLFEYPQWIAVEDRLAPRQND